MMRLILNPANLIVLIIALFGCEENIYDGEGLSEGNNYGDIIGTVKQNESGALVVVSQLVGIDSTQIDPITGDFNIYGLRKGNFDLTIHADNYGIFSQKNVMVDGGGVTYLGEIDLSRIPNHISGHYPLDRDEIVYSNRWQRINISILFTREMDRESVEEAFSTIPESEGIFYWGRYTTAPGPRYYSDELLGAFEEGATITTFSKITSVTYQMAQKDAFTDTTYRVILSTAARDTLENHLRFPLEFSFKTVQSSVSYKGIRTSPNHGDVDVDLMSSEGIKITFTRRMDAMTTENAVEIIPDQESIFLWRSGNELTVFTGGPFFADTTYEVTIAGTAEDRDGVPLGEDFTFSFTTAPVRVSSTSPSRGETYVEPNESITFWFNTYMLKSSVEAAFQINPPITGNFYWGTVNSSNVKNAITFRPSNSLDANTKYTVSLDRQSLDLYGTPMKEPYTFSFISRP